MDQVKKKYSPSEDFPLGWYAVTTVLFNALLIAVIRKSPAKIEMKDLFLFGVATHKLARIITKDEVTSFIRAPFTRYQEELGYGEVNETSRHSGGLRVVGELFSCNYCMSSWIGLIFFGGFSQFPVKTRNLARFFTVLTLSDFMHVAYEERRTNANVLTLHEKRLDQKKSDTSKEGNYERPSKRRIHR